MTGQGGMTVLLIIALTTVTSVTGAGPIPLTAEEEAQRDAAAAAMANLTAEDQVALPPGPIPPIPPCECHAHGDVRYVTCDGRAFRFNTLPWDVGIMAKPIGGWLWYIITEQEFFDGGPKTRLASVKFKMFGFYVIIEYKGIPHPEGLYTITVIDIAAPVPALYNGAVSLGPAGGPPGLLFVGGGFQISLILVNGDLYIEVSSTLLPPVLFDIRIRVARHCLQIHIPPIWSGFMEGICGDWNRFPANDVVDFVGLPQVTPAPFMGFPY